MVKVEQEYNRLRNLTGVVSKFRDGSWPKTQKAVKSYYETKMEQPTVLPLWLKMVTQYEDAVVALAVDLVETKRAHISNRTG